MMKIKLYILHILILYHNSIFFLVTYKKVRSDFLVQLICLKHFILLIHYTLTVTVNCTTAKMQWTPHCKF